MEFRTSPAMQMGRRKTKHYSRMGSAFTGFSTKGLFRSSEESSFWTLQAQVFPENKISIHLHEKHGFCKNGTRKQLALMTYGPRTGEWRDVVLMERRSTKAGI